MDHLPLRFGRRLSSKRRPAGEHFIQQGAEGVDVRGRPDRSRFTAHLLGGHITGSSQPGAAQRQRRLAFKVPRQPEIGDLGRPLAVSSILPGFRSRCTIPAWCATCTASASVIRSAAAWRAGCGVPERACARLPPSRSSIVKNGHPSCVTHIINLNDVRVVQPRHRLRFALKPRPLVGSRVRPGTQHLESDEPVQAQVPRLVDDAHPAAPEHRLDVVAGNLGPLPVQRLERSCCRSRRREQRVDLGLKLAKAPQAITDLAQQLRAGLTHFLRRAMRFEDLLDQISHSWIARHHGILPVPSRICLACGMSN